MFLTLSVRGTLKTTIEVATLELCNFSTIHSHASILGSFESQKPQFSFSRPEISPTTPGPLSAAPRPEWVKEKKGKQFFPSLTKFWLNTGVRTFVGQFYEFISQTLALTLSRRKRSVFLKKGNS